MSKTNEPTQQKKLSVEPYKGVRDFYPEEQAFLNYFISTCREFVERLGYVEYGASILEPSELYKAKGSQNEELVAEQTYTFEDRGGREVTLRPEMTPTVARMVAARRRGWGFPLRLYSIPNFFRYERPQRGRIREFWQLNVDLFGSTSFFADAEMIGMAYGLMTTFGATESDFVIKVGSRAFLDALVKELKLSESNAKHLFSLLDRRGKLPREAFEAHLRELNIPNDSLFPSEPPAEIAKLIRKFRDAAGIKNIVYDPSIVRGFAYYSGMVFEVFDTNTKNSRALMGGGRYDNLTKLFDDEPLPGVGFAVGDETMRLFLESRGLLPAYRPPAQVYIAITSPDVAWEAQEFAAKLRIQGVNVAVDFGEKKLGDQIKVANKHKIPFVIVLGPEELALGEVRIKELATGKESKLSKEGLAEFFLNLERTP